MLAFLQCIDLGPMPMEVANPDRLGLEIPVTKLFRKGSTMSDKPENFVVTRRHDKCIVERHFDMPNGDVITYRQTVDTKDMPDPSLIDLHRISADTVVRYLLQFLPAEYGENDPYLPGKKI